MYILDFMKSLFKKNRIPVIVYLIINVLIITYLVNMCVNMYIAQDTADGQHFYWFSILIALAAYAISVFIALSPIGEWIMRLQNGCRRIKRTDHIEQWGPIYKEVYSRAKQANPTIPDDVELFICDGKRKDAFAIGRKTICITRGMLKVHPEEFRGAIALQFAHIANHDTDLIKLITIGNMMITAMIFTAKIIFRALSSFGKTVNRSQRTDSGNLSIIIGAIGDALIGAMMWIWTKFGQYLVLATQRSNEYAADEFAFNLGYADGLCRFLDKYSGRGSKGLFAVLSSNRPAGDDRIARLQKLGCSYSA